MIKALVWKEWREQRALVFVGLALVAAMPALVLAVTGVFTPQVTGLSHMADVLPVIFALLLWPVFSLAAGAGTFANESGGGTLGYLVSRPVPRRAIWWAKVALAAAATGLVIAASAALALLVRWLVEPPATAASAFTAASGELGVFATAGVAPLTILMLFSAAVLFSTGGGRPMAAAGGALLAATMAGFALPATWPLTGLVDNVMRYVVAGQSLLISAAFLGVAFHRFTRREVSEPVRFGRTLATVTLSIALAVVFGFLPSLYAHNIADLERATVHDEAIGPRGENVVVTAAPYPSNLGSLWRLQADDGAGDAVAGAGAVRLTRRLAMSPFFSPDGGSVYYFTTGSWLGEPRGPVELRAVEIDGSEDRLIVADIATITDVGSWRRWPGEVARPVFSPDGTMAVFHSGWWNDRGRLIVHLDEGRAEFIRSQTTDEGLRLHTDFGFPLGWTPDGEIVTTASARDRRVSFNTVALYSVADRSSRVVWQSSDPDTDAYVGPLREGITAPITLVPIRRYVEEGFEAGRRHDSIAAISMLDVRTGEVDLIAELPCGYPLTDLSPDARTLMYVRYTGCAEGDDGFLDPTGRVFVLRDLETGNERLVEDFVPAGDGISARFSPDGSRAWLFSRWLANDFRIIEADGSERRVDLPRPTYENIAGDTILAQPRETPTWIDNDHVLVRYNRTRIGETKLNSLIVIDVNDGAVVRRFLVPSEGLSLY